MFSRITTGAIFGLEPFEVQVETDISGGLPQFNMVGLLNTEVREAGERVRVALRNSGIELPPSRITINFSPARIPKKGMAADLPVAAGIMTALGVLRPEDTEKVMISGELGLDGEVKKIRGALPLVRLARDIGMTTVILPAENASEGAMIGNIRVIGVRSLKQMIRYLMEPERSRDSIIAPAAGGERKRMLKKDDRSGRDLSDVHGQRTAKRTLEIAAAGFHNLLLIGPPGSGKSMLAECMPGILPGLTGEEQLRISEIYSIAGKLDPEAGLMQERPFLAPHHTVTRAALIGGGSVPVPGLITLADRGVLFMDEFPEFGRESLDLLREPLEEHVIRIARSAGTFVYPARFLLLAAMNPCPCGYYPDVNRCRCTEPEVRRYLARVSGPILDRIDLCAETSKITAQELGGGTDEETSAEVRVRVERAREIQRERFRGSTILFNGDMGTEELRKFCALSQEARVFAGRMYTKLGMTVRSYHRMLKTARTIADLDGKDAISKEHLAEAAAYRVGGKEYWKNQ